ncbi:MAG TPA: thiamine-phosphate kinase [Terracidiphilus sp.]|jgi:thiamine-monophosphate kinase|nr:thiamine-phosphate kinase [Terracidiphilus sp.]
MKLSRGNAKKTKTPGELALIGQIRRRAGKSGSAGVRLGIGDDCALLRLRPGEELAVTTDLSIAGQHFQLDAHPAHAVGHRTLARGLSDLAAMGARPVAAFLSLGLPPALTEKHGRKRAWVEEFLDGLLALAEEYDTQLAGGDLAEAPVAVADIVLTGAVPQGRALLRAGAHAGDALYVTGTLGGSAVGLKRIKAGKQGAKGKGTAEALAAHLYPRPRVAQGLWLQRRGAATACIDLSDGLSTDLQHVCEESGVHAEVDAAALPVAQGATLEQALHGGEDYELLFTARPEARIPRGIAGIAVTRIGRILQRRAGRPVVMLLRDGRAENLVARGWEHFS